MGKFRDLPVAPAQRLPFSSRDAWRSSSPKPRARTISLFASIESERPRRALLVSTSRYLASAVSVTGLILRACLEKGRWYVLFDQAGWHGAKALKVPRNLSSSANPTWVTPMRISRTREPLLLIASIAPISPPPFFDALAPAPGNNFREHQCCGSGASMGSAAVLRYRYSAIVTALTSV